MLSDRLSCLSCPVCNVGVLWPNGWIDQDETWHAGRPWPWPHCVRWGPSSPSLKEAQPPSNFRPISVAANGCMDQDASWYGDRPAPRRLYVRWGPRSPFSKRGQSPPPQFSAHFYCGQTAACIKMPLGMEVGFSPGDFVLDGDPGRPKFSAYVYYSYCDFVLHSRYWFVQVQVQVLYAFYF